MGRRSAISQLDEAVRDEVHRLIRQGRTIDEITAHLHELDADVSRASVGRYKRKMEDQLRRYREAQEVAGVWVKNLGEDPRGEMGRLLADMLKTVAFQTLADMGDEGAEVGSQDIMFLARAIKDLETAAKSSMEREIRIRDLTRMEAAEAVEEAAANAGLSSDTVEKFRAAILGVS
ncbi:MAG: DUF3486 family protein [Geminicoccaceae bacterium]|nr:DUF3486 family protein [Geminicoccaceae bacterium]